jgi:deazaflavin-dependent oxidoreductase (nitroreductase family)
VSIRARFFWVLKNTLNRATIRLARTRFGPFSLVRHVGRKSGRSYETPLILVRVPDGFIAELTYGEDVDWYRNVVAARGCTVIHHGAEFRVISVETCTSERGRAAFPPPFRQILRVLGRSEFRLLRTER